MARQREHVLEKLQMGHEEKQVAFKPGLAALGGSRIIITNGLGSGLTEFRPGGRRHAIGKAPGPHQDWRPDYFRDPARCKTDMKRMSCRPKQTLDIQPAPARDKRGVRIKHHGKSLERCGDGLIQPPSARVCIILVQAGLLIHARTNSSWSA